jgi:hypothetical protein
MILTSVKLSARKKMVDINYFVWPIIKGKTLHSCYFRRLKNETKKVLRAHQRCRGGKQMPIMATW